MTKPISQQTPVSLTLALAITIGSGLFYAGKTVADHRNEVASVKQSHEEFKKDTLEWRSEVTKLLSEMVACTRDNKRRLDAIER